MNPPTLDMPQPPADEALLAAFRQSGDRKALNQLLARHLRPIRAVVFAMVLDHAAADDVTQEVFLQAFRRLDSYREEAQFSTWLYRLAINATYTFLRRQRGSPLEYMPDPPEAAGTKYGAAQAVLQAELDAQITSALASLSPKLRAVIVLTTIHQASIPEVAAMEGCSQATVYWRLHKARRLLKRRLRRYLSS